MMFVLFNSNTSGVTDGAGTAEDIKRVTSSRKGQKILKG
jgi:hypothetical protein